MNPEQRSDEQLMLAFSRGEAPAFDELFLRYWERLRRFFVRRLDERSRAEELTQETFLAVFRAAGRYEPRALFRTYLYAIALRVLRRERRRARMRALFLLPWAGPEAAVAPGGEEGLWVRQALERLPAKERELLMLREYDQLAYAEIAALLGMRLNTVRSKLFRARQALREVLLSKEKGKLPAKVAVQEEET